MPFVGTGHIWLLAVLLIIVLIIWGPGKLPEVGSGVGRALREFRKASSQGVAEFATPAAADAPDRAAPIVGIVDAPDPPVRQGAPPA